MPVRSRLLSVCASLCVVLAPLTHADVPSTVVGALKWRQVGPFRGGRVEAVTGVPGDAATWYFGAVAGGVWKSTDAGASWQPMFDGQSISSIGAIAVADSDHNVLYVGTGEPCPRGNITYGDGVYKSTDGGRSWHHIGLPDSEHIGAVTIDPRNPDVVMVAALGHAYGPNTERGVFRTTDGGRSWQKVLYKDADTGAADVVLDPSNPSIAYASLWQMRREPWHFTSGGPGSGLYKSTDGGATWAPIQGHGLPTGLIGRIGLSVAGGGSGRVYALVEAEEGGLYRSDDQGATWTRVNSDHRFRQRAWYFSHVFADPQSPDVVYVANTGLFRSNDGGRTFDLLSAPHGDHHGMWIDPTNPRRMIESSDGGASLSMDGGAHWSAPYNQPTAQFYHVVADNHVPYRIYGAQQDNSTIAIASRTDAGVIGRQDWYPVGGGESGYIAPDPRDPEIVYANDNSGVITRYDHRTGEMRDVSPYPLDTSGQGAAEQKFRLQWTEPLFVSQYDSNVLYTASQYVLRSQDQGKSWQTISPDLTRDDKTKQTPSGGDITLDITSVEYYDTVFTLAESPRERGLLWAGTDDGLVQLTRDDGGHWANVTPKDLPAWSLVSMVEASPHDAATAFLAVDRHKLDDKKPLIYRTHDFGKTWTRIVTGLPDGAYVRSVREDPVVAGLLYAATERGVYVSADDGAHWQSLQLNLPPTPIHDLIVKDGDLVAATHGRAFWILDDLSPVRQASHVALARAATLLKPAVAVRRHIPEEVERRLPVGDNPPAGAVIDYVLKDKPKDDEEVVLEFLDSSGAVLKRYSNHRPADAYDQPAEWTDREAPVETIPAEAGANRFAWNMRREDPTPLPGAVYGEGEPHGPLIRPGHYHVRLTFRGETSVEPLDVVLDPRLTASVKESDLAALEDLALSVGRDIDALHRAVNAMRDVRAKLVTLQKWAASDPAAKPVLTSAEQLLKHMASIEEELVQVRLAASEDTLRYPVKLNEQLAYLANVLAGDAAPTVPEKEVAAALHERLETQLARWQTLASGELPALNEALHRAGIPQLAVAAR